MKKLIIGLVLVGFLGFPLVSYAATPQEAYRQAILQLIDLLLKRVAELQKQLAEEQLRVSQPVSNSPTPIDIPPQIGVFTPTPVVDTTPVPKPVIRLSGQAYLYGGGTGNQTWSAISEEINAPIVKRTWTGNFDKPMARFRILTQVGGADCEKFGYWSGRLNPEDHWEENMEIATPGRYELGVRCGDTSKSILVNAY